MYKKLLLAVVALSISVFSPLSAQNAGDLVPEFNSTGIFTIDFYGNTDVINDIAVQEDGKVVAVGVAFTPAFNIDVKIIRVLSDGTLDADFSEDGIVTIKPMLSGYYETHATSVIIKENGKILVAGMVLNDDAIFDIMLVQLNEDGSFDTDFGINGISTIAISDRNDLAQDLTLNSEGQILVAGMIENDDFNYVPTVMRFNENGTLDDTFGNGGLAQIQVNATDNEFTSICLQQDGKILASGHKSNPNWAFEALLCRFLPDGTLDNSFGTNGVVTYNKNNIDDEFFGMDLTENEEIICGGFTTYQGGSVFDMLLVKFDTTGNLATDFGINGAVTYHYGAYNVIYDLLVQPDDKILVCGSAGDFAPGNNDWAMLRYKENGGIDFFFGNDGVVLTEFLGQQDEAHSMALSGDDRIYLGGKTLNPTIGVRDFTIGCYYNDLTTLISPSEQLSKLSVYPNPASGKTFVYQNENSILNLFDIQGNRVKSWNVNSTAFELDLSGIAPGMYLLKAINGEEISISKIIVR